MSIHFIQGKFAGKETAPTAIKNDAAGRAIIRYLPTRHAGIAYDVVDGVLKYNANGTMKTITATTTASSLVLMQQVASVDLDGSHWHNGVGGKHDVIAWDVPEDILITQVMVRTTDPADHTMALLLLLLLGQSPVGTIFAGLDLGAGPVLISNLDVEARHGKIAKKTEKIEKGKKHDEKHDDDDDDDADEVKRQLFAPKGSRLEFRASDDPTGLVGKALIFYVAVPE